MSQEHEQEQESKSEHSSTVPPGAPVITWERPVEHIVPSKSGSQVISIDDYRRQSLSESEATITVREFRSQDEEPVRLLIISSGFGQKQPPFRHTLQSRAAA